mmetsp:Transcript_56285/g.157901  ORF Transcript_56285/g.157901 Transcript_56285/m.157901 type:complete len:83 (+) Transcript_56285:154-402(+)
MLKLHLLRLVRQRLDFGNISHHITEKEPSHQKVRNVKHFRAGNPSQIKSSEDNSTQDNFYQSSLKLLLSTFNAILETFAIEL